MREKVFKITLNGKTVLDSLSEEEVNLIFNRLHSVTEICKMHFVVTDEGRWEVQEDQWLTRQVGWHEDENGTSTHILIKDMSGNIVVSDKFGYSMEEPFAEGEPMEVHSKAYLQRYNGNVK